MSDGVLAQTLHSAGSCLKIVLEIIIFFRLLLYMLVLLGQRLQWIL